MSSSWRANDRARSRRERDQSRRRRSRERSRRERSRRDRDLKESWPRIGAGLEAWADQQLAATFTRDCLYYSTSLNTRVDTNLLELYARAWSARWEDRTKADAFVAAMGRIREEMVQQYEDDLERRIRERAERRMRGEYGSDYDEEDY